MPVSLKGSTSGDITINAPAVAGTTSITLPAVSGGQFIVSNSSGNVGIGTASPTVPLDIRGNSTGRISQYIVNANTTANSASELVLYTDNAAEYIGLVGFTNAAGYLSFNNPAGGVVGVVPAQPLQFRTTDIERLRIAANGQLSAVVPGGSTLYPSYTARAWVNFNGTGTVAIRASGNVTSITDGGTGTYTVNLTTAMPDANFAASIMSDRINAGNPIGNVITAQTASSLSMVHIEGGSGTLWDTAQMQVAIFR